MSIRELVVLGTASQVPTRYRNHNGYFLRWDEEGILFDPGEGTQRQLTLADLSASSITRIAITHFHGDHCLGLAGVTQRLSLDKAQHRVEVYYPASGQVFYDRLRRASIFQNQIEVKACPIHNAGPQYRGRKFTLSCLPLDHGVDTWGYRLEEHDDCTMLPDKLAAFGIAGPAVGVLKRQGWLETADARVTLDEVSLFRPGQRVAFVMDTRLCDNAFALAEKADLLICESTYLSSESREAQANGHLTAAQAARIARESGATKLVLSHFSQRYPSTAPFLHEAQEIFPNVVVARDLDHIAVPKRIKA